MAELRVVDDNPPFQECEACGYSWISDDEQCPSCREFGVPDSPIPTLLVNWAEFWNRDQSAEDWLVWPLVPAGRGVALYAPAKAGKSLVVLALVAAAATGGLSLDGQYRPAVHVLYLDYEMTLDDLQERLEDLGYGPDTDLEHLHYASLPSLPPLDQPEGAKAVIALVEATGAQAVVIDTLGRAVEGDENEADTVRSFYRWTGLALKAAGVAFLRTDHAGKDLGKGQRGSSAKNDDVDVVWQLSRNEGGVTLKATHRRMAWVPETVQIAVDESEGWAFSLAESESYPTGTKELAELIARLDVPIEAPSSAVFSALKEAGHKRRRTAILAAIRWRKDTLPVFSEAVHQVDRQSGNRPGNRLPDKTSGTVAGTNGTGPDDIPSDQDGNHGNQIREPREPVPAAPMGVVGSLVEGTTPQADEESDPSGLF